MSLKHLKHCAWTVMLCTVGLVSGLQIYQLIELRYVHTLNLCACDILTTVDCDWFPQWCLSMNQNHPMWSYSLFLSSSSSSSLLVIPALKMFFPFSGLSWFGWKHLLCLVPLNKNILLMWNSWCLCNFFFLIQTNSGFSDAELNTDDDNQFDCYWQNFSMCNEVLWLSGLKAM